MFLLKEQTRITQSDQIRAIPAISETSLRKLTGFPTHKSLSKLEFNYTLIMPSGVTLIMQLKFKKRLYKNEGMDKKAFQTVKKRVLGRTTLGECTLVSNIQLT